MKPIVMRPQPIRSTGTTATRTTPPGVAVAPKKGFGEDRATMMQQQLDQSLRERRIVAAAEAGTAKTDQSLSSALKQRGQLIERRIDSLNQQLAEQT
ncbi:hypothetical protein KBC79_04935 [Candidatus Woesebacteria bacterium]|nr:hypothetical protein [Candidatus Woesebacteria bacterium]